MNMPDCPLKPLFDIGDAFLSIAPHNVLATMFSGGAKPKIIHSLDERGSMDYIGQMGL
jgi:hypothetical protein